MKTILILGGGVGGVVTAKVLRKKIGKECRIILFEKEDNHVFAASLLWLLVGKRKPNQVFRNIRKLAGSGIEIVKGEIEKVIPEALTVSVNGKEFKGDYMVISLGAEQVPEYNLNEIGFNFYTLEGASRFYQELKKFIGGKIVILVPSLPFKCPAAPYEAAMLIASYISKKGLTDKTEISLYVPEPAPMGVAGKELSGAVRQIVESKGVKYYPEYQITGTTKDMLTFDNGEMAEYDLLAFTPKHQIPSVIKNTVLAHKSGWIEIDRHTLEMELPNVFAVGDITFIPLEMGKPLPKAGVFAHYQAETVAHNIAQQIIGEKNFKVFNGDGHCFLEMGNGKAGYAGGNFYASPLPNIKMKKPGYFWHWTKVWFERYWWFKYF